MKNTVCIDWLSYTAAHSDHHNFILPPWADMKEARPEIPRFGYTKAIKFPSGLVIMYDGATATMGSHYIYSGQCLNHLADVLNDGGVGVIEWHEGRGHKCTRCDLAIDVYEGRKLIADVARLAEDRKFTGTAHSATTIKSSGGTGLTVYIGSRTSERFVRVYDKSAQLGQQGEWTRIECEVKGDSARAVTRAILVTGNGGLDLVARSVIGRVCTFDVASWRAVMEGPTLEIGAAKIEEKKTEEWIMNSVAKAVAKFDREYPDRHIVERLFMAIEGMLGEP